MSFGTEFEPVALDLENPVSGWWDEYGSYIWFGLGGLVGWTLARLLSPSATVVIRPEGRAGESMRGLSRRRRTRRR